MTPTEIIAAYDALLKRAEAVVVMQGDSCTDPDETDLKRLSVAGSDATLTWMKDGYETAYARDESFSALLLGLSDAEFAQWLADEKAAKEEKERLQAEARRHAAKEHEFQIFLQLRAKYEPQT